MDKLKLQGYIAILIAIILIIAGLYFIMQPYPAQKVQAQEDHSNERLKLTYTQKVGQWHTINIYHDEQTGYNCYESVYEGNGGSTGVGFSCV